MSSAAGRVVERDVQIVGPFPGTKTVRHADVACHCGGIIATYRDGSRHHVGYCNGGRCAA